MEELQAQLSDIQSQLATLIGKVTQLEDDLGLVADVYRYQKLRKYLAAANWFEADLETVNLILDGANANKDNLKPEDIQRFPCKELVVIDQLWLKYSNRRFGFTAQLALYQECGGSLETTITRDQRIIEKWGDRLGWRDRMGWRKCEQLDYSLNAPVGCHPSQWWNSPYGSKMTNYFLARLMTCDL